MPRVQDKDFVTFNDGILDICETEERKIVGTKAVGVRFGNRTVGVTRFWNAKVAASTVDALVAIPNVPYDVTTHDICLIGDRQFKILQVQNKFDQYPPHLLLSLERNPIIYKDVRT